MEYNTIFFISLIIFYLLLGIIVIFIVKKYRKKIDKRLIFDKKSLEDFTKFNGATLYYKEREYTAKYQKGSRNTPPTFLLSINIKSFGKFKISFETAFDKFAKKINIAKEIQTGEHKFDERFYIDSSTTGFTKTFLTSNDVRDKITQLFDFGFTEMFLKNNSLTLMVNLNKSNIKIDEKVIEKTLDILYEINDSLLKVTNYQANNGNVIKRILMGFYSSIILLGITGFILFIIGIIRYKPLDPGKIFIESLLYSMIAFIIYFYFSIKLLRGRSSSHKELLLIFIIAFFSFIIAGFGWRIFFNGYLDKSIIHSHDTAVIKKYYVKGKNGRTYYLKINSWRKDRNFESLRVSRRFYKQMKVNSYIQINTKKGKFGYEWIKNYKKSDFRNMK